MDDLSSPDHYGVDFDDLGPRSFENSVTLNHVEEPSMLRHFTPALLYTDAIDGNDHIMGEVNRPWEIKRHGISDEEPTSSVAAAVAAADRPLSSQATRLSQALQANDRSYSLQRNRRLRRSN